MYNSIQHFNEFGTKKIEEIIKNFIGEKKDLADLIMGIQESLFDLGRNIVKEVLEDMDEHIRNSGIRKNDWEIVRKDDHSLLTSFGTVRYSRTYFKHKKNKNYRHLVDEIIGINPHERMSADVRINAINEAIDNSYKKAGEKVSYVEELSKQGVMNKVHQIQVQDAPLQVFEKKAVRILYIEADEDHVALQQKGKKEEKNKKQRISMPKLIYVHEGIDTQRSTSKRKVLKNVRYFGGDLKSDELWLKVAEYIDKQYDVEKIETIYISGDGASWIRQGLDWIVKSRFVLDNHHLNKYMTVATAHLNDDAMHNALRDALEWPDKKMLKDVFNRILELTDTETKKAAVKDARRYMLNNWDGIEIKAEKGDEIVGCSAEGHVSHVFSDRLSSRPKGWSIHGVAQMSELRIYKKNGGKVYDLVMAQKTKEQKEKKIEVQDQMIKNLRKSWTKYEDVVNIGLTAINRGHKTGLYKELRNIIGRCG